MIESLNNDYENSIHFTDAEKAAIGWAVIMTEKLYQGAPGKPPQHRPAMEELKKYYSNAQIVELTHAIGYTNYWNRFTDILEIELEDKASVDKGKDGAIIDVDQYVEYMNSCWWNDHEPNG
jgi:alkylhydroperoxidase family enzyme